MSRARCLNNTRERILRHSAVVRTITAAAGRQTRLFAGLKDR
ncbi:MAG: hypothetical protein WB561_18295 [Terracidiphilus sp.]